MRISVRLAAAGSATRASVEGAWGGQRSGVAGMASVMHCLQGHLAIAVGPRAGHSLRERCRRVHYVTLVLGLILLLLEQFSESKTSHLRSIPMDTRERQMYCTCSTYEWCVQSSSTLDWVDMFVWVLHCTFSTYSYVYTTYVLRSKLIAYMKLRYAYNWFNNQHPRNAEYTNNHQNNLNRCLYTHTKLLQLS